MITDANKIGLRKGMDKSAVIADLNRYYITNKDNLSYEYKKTDAELVFITGKNHYETNIPNFNIPLLSKNSKGTVVVYVDIRPYVKNVENIDEKLDGFIRDKFGFQYELVRAIITANQVYNEFQLSDVKVYTARRYTRWITHLLRNNLALTLEEMDYANILVAKYLLDMFDLEDADDKGKSKDYAGIIFTMNARTIDMAIIEKVLKDHPNKFSRLTDLVVALKSFEGSAKFKRLDATLIYTYIKPSWFGTTAVTNLNTAMEHVPSLVTFFYLALTDKNFNKTNLAVNLSTFKDKSDKQFIKLIEDIIKSAK